MSTNRVPHNYKTRNTLPEYFEPHWYKSQLKLKLSAAEVLYLYPTEIPAYSIICVYYKTLDHNLLWCGTQRVRIGMIWKSHCGRMTSVM